MEVGEVLKIGLYLARGLSELHAVNMVLADLKPDNILLEEDGRAVLTDFGISKAYSSTQMGAPYTSSRGTPNFM